MSCVLEPAPDPFELPRRQVRGIYHYSSAGEVNRRIGVRGVVTAVVPGHPVEMKDFTTTATFRYVLHVLYLKDETGGLRIETEQEPAVVPGDIVEAAGFPAVTPGKPVLQECGVQGHRQRGRSLRRSHRSASSCSRRITTRRSSGSKGSC
jgi:hypothetical protein